MEPTGQRNENNGWSDVGGQDGGSGLVATFISAAIIPDAQVPSSWYRIAADVEIVVAGGTSRVCRRPTAVAS